MNAGEMHALEKAALADPFLGDALEGYAFTHTPVKDVDDLKENLLTRKSNKKVFFLYPKQSGWLSIAALFILIAGIGFMAYELNFNKGNNELAKQESNFKTTQQPTIPKIDSNNTDLVTVSPTEKSNENLIDKNIPQIPKPEPNSSMDNSLAKNSEKTREEHLRREALAESKKDYASSVSKINLLQGMVMDNRGNPVKYATIVGKDRKIMATSDSSGKFKLLLNDTSLTATIAMIGYKTKISRLSYKNEQTIVMEPDNQSLNEVVVTAAGVRRQRKELASSPQTMSKASEIAVDNSNSEPIIGWQKFNEYVKDNINIPEDDEGDPFKGKVVLSFEINEKGIPKKIKVDQSLCESCDKEAIRLLLQGPKWKHIKNQRQNVTIQF